MIKFLQSILKSNNIPVQVFQDFFLIGGQSNTGTNISIVDEQAPTGRVSYTLMPTELQGLQQGIKVWNGNDVNDYTHPVNEEYGWINHFLKIYKETGKTPTFYKYGEGGKQLATNGPFSTYTRNRLLTNGLNAWNYFKANNPNPRIIFLWNQGFTDGLDQTNALNYGAHEVSNPNHATGGNLGAWFEEVRTHFSGPNMKIIYNTLSNNATASTFRADVKLGQEYVATLSPHNILVNADDLEYQSDQSHFSNNGVIGLANRYLTQYNTL